MMMPRVVKRYWRNVAAIVFSWFLLLGSLYQLEIVTIAALQGLQQFSFPFYVWTCSVWFARDLFYLGIVLSWIVLFAALWWWE